MSLVHWPKFTTQLNHGQKNTIISKCKKIRVIFKRVSDPALLKDLPSIDNQIDISIEKSVDQMVLKITDGLIELNTVFNSVIARFRDLILSELNVPVLVCVEYRRAK